MNEDLISKTIASYDLYAKEYDESVSDIPMQPQTDIFLSLLKKNSLILDMGCGQGRDTKRFCEKGHRVIGIDLSKELLKIAERRTYDASFIQMDIRNMEFKADAFDGLWACASLIHIPKKDMPKTLEKSYEIAREGCIFYATVKKGDEEKTLFDKKYGNTQKSWSFFQKKEMENFLEEAGFKMISDKYFENKSAVRTEDVWLNFFCRK